MMKCTLENKFALQRLWSLLAPQNGSKDSVYVVWNGCFIAAENKLQTGGIYYGWIYAYQ